MIGEYQHIARPRAERRQRHHLETQPVEQVGTELVARDLVGQMLVGRSDDADIDAHRPRRADPRHLAIFYRAQQPILCRHRQCAELVEKQCAAMRLLETPGACPCRAGEGTRLMAEQLGLDERFGQRGAVHDDQRLVPARRQTMEALGNQFLAGTAFADHQHRTIERRRAAGPLQRVEKRP